MRWLGLANHLEAYCHSDPVRASVNVGSTSLNDANDDLPAPQATKHRNVVEIDKCQRQTLYGP